MVFDNIEDFKDNAKIAIIGGAGRMGRWGLNYFDHVGCQNLHYYDINTDSAEEIERETGAQLVVDKRKMVSLADLLIVSVLPKDKKLDAEGEILKVIDEVGPEVRPDAIFADFSSEKQVTCERMSRYSAHAIGIHQMFKNTVDPRASLEGMTIGIHPQVYEGNEPYVNLLSQIFGETGASTPVISPQEHDQITKFNQMVPHILFELCGRMQKAYCRATGLSPTQLTALDTPNSALLNMLMGRRLLQNHELLWSLLNKQGAEGMWNLADSTLQGLLQTLREGDKRQFLADVRSTARKFGQVRTIIAGDESDRVVGSLKKSGYYEATKQFLEEEISRRCYALGIRSGNNNNRNKRRDFEVVMGHTVSLYQSMITNFEGQNYTGAADAAISLKRNIQRQVLKSGRRFKEVRTNTEEYGALINALGNFIGRCQNLQKVR